MILDIFAQNAASQEGKAQVELALLRYRLPRLRGRGKALSQQAGGMSRRRGRIGTRGPGETQLEVDRRRIQRRIHKLEADLARDRPAPRRPSARPAHRSRLAQSPSSATPTPASRRCSTASPTPACSSRTACSPPSTPPPAASTCPGGESGAASPTPSGFIRKLPHQLVEAFKSTLEVAAEADLLVHVVDASAADPAEQIEAVRDVLAEIGAGDVPELLAFNKADRAAREAKRPAPTATPARSRISARTGEGIDELLRAVGRPPAGR